VIVRRKPMWRDCPAAERRKKKGRGSGGKTEGIPPLRSAIPQERKGAVDNRDRRREGEGGRGFVCGKGADRGSLSTTKRKAKRNRSANPRTKKEGGKGKDPFLGGVKEKGVLHFNAAQKKRKDEPSGKLSYHLSQ